LQLNDFSDKPLLIHFWATWCEICKHEIPDIEKIAETFQVINIAIQSGSDLEVEKFAKAHGMTSSIIANDKNGDLEALYRANTVPASFIIDGLGEIRHAKIGYSTYRELNEKLMALKP